MATITITIPDWKIRSEGFSAQDVQYLLGDALYEFACRRNPPETYVAERYKDSPELRTDKKVEEVARRRRLAEYLRGPITLELDGDEE